MLTPCDRSESIVAQQTGYVPREEPHISLESMTSNPLCLTSLAGWDRVLDDGTPAKRLPRWARVYMQAQPLTKAAFLTSFVTESKGDGG